MKAKRIVSLLLAAALAAGTLAMPAAAAALPDETPEPAVLDETNEMVSISIKPAGELVYGSPIKLTIETSPADTQYIGVLLGISGEAKGFVTLQLSDKLRTLLRLVPLPRKMSATPEQEEEFNLYAYIKQLIDGHDVGVLLRVAEEVASVMDTLQFYVPTISGVSDGLKTALALIRRYIPENTDTGTRIYLDEQPVDSGRYFAGAVALESGDINTAGIAMFSIKPKSENVSLQWSAQLPETITAEQAAELDITAYIESDGHVAPEARVSYTYKRGGKLLSLLSGAEATEGFPTEPGEYTQTATVTGNYSCSSISRKITITG